jgi:hypothetical protein
MGGRKKGGSGGLPLWEGKKAKAIVALRCYCSSIPFAFTPLCGMMCVGGSE